MVKEEPMDVQASTSAISNNSPGTTPKVATKASKKVKMEASESYLVSFKFVFFLSTTYI